MKKNKILFFQTAATLLLIACCSLPAAYSFAGNNKSTPEQKAKAEQYMAQQKPLGFRENKGQIADMDGNPAPYVHFKAEATNLNIWITDKGITYQFFKMEEEHEKENSEARSQKPEARSQKPETRSQKPEEEEEKITGEWHRVDMTLKDATIKKENIVTENDITKGKVDYYLGHCPDGIFNVKTHTKITIKNVYQGIDWVLYTSPNLTPALSKGEGETQRRGENGGGLKYDFIVHPNADPSQIKLIYEGSGKINIQDNQIHFENELGNITEGKLLCYQGSESNVVKSSYTIKKNNSPLFSGAGNSPLAGNISPSPSGRAGVGLSPLPPQAERLGGAFSYEVSPSIPNYNHSKPLIIDPSLVWGTLFAGNGFDGVMSTTIDANGNLFATGYSNSANFPVQNAGSFYQGTFVGGNEDVFIIKFDNTGKLIWSTFYGGTGFAFPSELGNSITTDQMNNVFVTGTTISTDFPVQNAGTYFVGTAPIARNVFILKFDNAGNRLWATYFGGNGNDYGYSITTDGFNNIFITGWTRSSNFPTQDIGTYYQGTAPDFNEAFISKFDNSGNLLWSTYYGGDFDDIGRSITTDKFNNVWITGLTSSTNFPVQTAGSFYQPTNGDGGNFTEDAFILKFDNSGNRLWATYYGGSTFDQGISIRTDDNNNVFITGTTNSTDFPVQTAGTFFQSTFNGGTGSSTGDAFILKFDNVGNRLWATYYGGSDDEDHESFQDLAIDTNNNVYVAFYTTSIDMQTLDPGCSYYDGTYGGVWDGFIAQFSNTGVLLWASYLGSNNKDFIRGLSANNNNLFMGGEFWSYPNSSSLPMLNPGGTAYFDSVPRGGEDSFILKFSPLPPVLNATAASTITFCSVCNGTATVNVTGCDTPFTYVWVPLVVQTTPTVTGLCAGSYTVTVTDNTGSTVTATTSVAYPVTIAPSISVVPCSDGLSNGSAIATPIGGAFPYTYSWTPTAQTNDTATGLAAGTYSVLVTDNNSCTGTAQAVIAPCIAVLMLDSILIPNVFSPNGDGVNDIFTFPNAGYKTLHCEIYNRWGTKIYEWNDVKGGWDGRTTTGKTAVDGVYYYIMTAEKNSGEELKNTGFLQLLRNK